MAIGPIDYTSMQPQVNFLQDISQGYQLGSAIRQRQDQLSAQAAAQEQAKKLAEDYNTDVLAAMQAPTPQNFAKLALKYPQQREAIKQSWEQLDEGERKAQGEAAAQAYSALLAGKPDLARQVVKSRIDALTNSDMDASAEKNILATLDSSPSQAQAALGFMLSHIGDPKSFASQFGALGQETRAAAAEPLTTAKVQEEILTAQQKRRLDEFDAQIKAANSENDRARLTLERDKFMAEQGIKGQAAGDAAQSDMVGIEQSLRTLDDLEKDPLLDEKSFGSKFGVGSVIGKALGIIPGTENKDFRARIDVLKSQQFLTNVQALKGLGALSEKEGDKVQSAIASLDPDMSLKAFKNALGVIRSTLNRAYEKAKANPKLPTTGGGYVGTVNGMRVNEGDVNRLLKQFPNATREQVLEYLKQSGGK